MIQIVKTVYVKRPGEQYVVWSALPIVPATALVEVEKTKEDAGWMQTVRFQATLYSEHTWQHKKLLIRILFDEGPILDIGSSDIPVELAFSLKNNVQEVSFEHRSRLDV
ncbi:MAG: hypothetical protein IJE21_07245 [Alistipes sp.]|nr:hypothetical protein [Alistipes sp.]